MNIDEQVAAQAADAARQRQVGLLELLKRVRGEEHRLLMQIEAALRGRRLRFGTFPGLDDLYGRLERVRGEEEDLSLRLRWAQKEELSAVDDLRRAVDPRWRRLEHRVERIVLDPAEALLALAAVRGIKPFVAAYAEALGKRLGESTAAALLRLRLSRPRVHGRTELAADQAGAVRVELDARLPDEARLALLDLDVTSPEYRGRTLRWDTGAGCWQGIEEQDQRLATLVLTLALARGFTPLFTAYAQALGEGLGERTADGLRRLRLHPPADRSSETEQATDAAESVVFEVDPEATEPAILALMDLDVSALELRGATLRWDASAEIWLPVESRR